MVGEDIGQLLNAAIDKKFRYRCLVCYLLFSVNLRFALTANITLCTVAVICIKDQRTTEMELPRTIMFCSTCTLAAFSPCTNVLPLIDATKLLLCL